jgi:hypothetical protein
MRGLTRLLRSTTILTSNSNYQGIQILNNLKQAFGLWRRSKTRTTAQSEWTLVATRLVVLVGGNGAPYRVPMLRTTEVRFRG